MAENRIELPNGAMLLVIIKDGKVLHYSANLGLSHVEFVKRTTGSLPQGAWVGTVHKAREGIIAFSSKSFYERELPGPAWVQEAARAAFK